MSLKSVINQGQTMRHSSIRFISAAFIVIAGHFLLVGILTFGVTNESVARRDFISYWVAGHQLLNGANPYDIDAVQNLERETGGADNQPLLVMRNPPIVFFLVLPLGIVSPKVGLILWLLVLLSSLSLSIWLIWLLNGRPDNRFHLMVYAFAPAIACLMAGQVGVFLLLGVVLFLYFHESRPYVAGAALLLCAIKPHLFLPFAIVLLLWVISRKSYRIILGFSAALVGSCALAFYWDAHAWSQYSEMMRAGGALNEHVPVLSVAFRFLVNRNAVWIQFLPEALACVWAIWYFSVNRKYWCWMDQGLLVLLVAVMCTPFGWFTDESMLLPAVLTGLYRAAENRRSLIPLGLIAGVALAEVLVPVQIISPFYLWTTPAWLAWYLYATRNDVRPANNSVSSTMVSAV
jgi:hypothetical protein